MGSKKAASGEIGSGGFALAALPIAVGVLVLFQGGFYAGAACAVAAPIIAAYLAALIAGRLRPCVSAATPLLLCVGCAYLASAFVNGPSVSMVVDSCVWFALAGVSLWAGAVRQTDSPKAVDALCWVGIAFAAAGILLATGLLPVEGTMNAGRLQFFFQYANTAGAWFAAIALLASASGSPRIRGLALLPMLAMLLTQSVGAIGLYLICMAVEAFVLFKRGRGLEVAGQLASFVAALIAFLAGQLLGAAATALAAAAMSAIALSGRLEPLVSRISSQPKAVLAATCALVVAVPLLAAVAFPQRLAQASQTFVERYVQVLDGLSALSVSPVIGIGPDMWQHVFPFVQSAQYYAGAVHCGYLQVALDAGVVGLAAFLAFALVGLVGSARRRESARLIAACLILAHALIDFDLQFASVIVTLVLIMYAGDGGLPAGEGAAKGGRAARDGKPKKGKPAGKALASRASLERPASAPAIALASLALAASVVGIACDIRKDAACAAVEPELAAPAASLSLAQGLLANDPDVVTAQYTLLYQAGDYEGVVRLYEQRGAFVASQTAVVTSSMMALGDTARAGDILVGGLEGQPYNTDLFEAAAELFSVFGIDPGVEARYREAVDRANELAVLGNARLLSNQAAVKECETL